jgi:hypothetical protein
MEGAEISSSIIAGCIPGYGFGQLIQDRADDGIKFMIGEVSGGGVFFITVFAVFFDTIFSIMSPYDIPEDRMLTYKIIAGTGMGIYLIFKTWSIIDLLSFPVKHNKMYEQLMKKDE